MDFTRNISQTAPNGRGLIPWSPAREGLPHPTRDNATKNIIVKTLKE